jgi:exonuclease III
VLAAHKGRPHLLEGDFNALRPGDPVGLPPPGEQKRGDAVDGAPRRAIGLLLEAGYVDTYRTLHPRDPGYTYPTRAPWLRLDFHFASPELAMRLRRCDVVSGEQAKQASDHFPLWSAFR